MSREDYERRLVMPLRQVLQDQEIQQSIRVLVTGLWGASSSRDRRRSRQRNSAGSVMRATDSDAARLQLVDIERQARGIAVQSGSKPAPTHEGANKAL